MAAKSLLHSSSSRTPSCFLNSRSNPINFRRTQLGFEPRNLTKPVKICGDQALLGLYGAKTKEKHQKQRGGGVVGVRCTAEGIERGLLMGGGGGGGGGGGRGGGEAKVLVAERYKMVGLLASVLCLCNADRVVMSVAIVPLAAKFGWSSSFLGIVQSSFLWGYIFSSVVGGALVDKYGGKKVLAWGVVLWSVATLLTPSAASHSTAALLAVRAFFGLAEGVAMPAMSTLSSSWFPRHERAKAIGISMGGFHLGNLVGLLLTPIMLSTLGIAGPFILFSALGLLWVTKWSSTVTNDPQESPFVTQSELRLIQAGKSNSVSNNGKFPPLRLLLSKLPTWAIILSNVTNNWGYFVLLSWMPVYFKTVFNVNLKQAAWFSAVPWGSMAVCGYIAGVASDHLIRTGYPVILVRKIMQTIGFIGPGISLLCLNYAKSPEVAAILITAALSLGSFSQAGYLLNIQEIAPEWAGFLHGLANSAGTLAAIISTIGTGYFVQWLGSFQAFLTVTAGLYFVTAIFFNLFATADRVF